MPKLMKLELVIKQPESLEAAQTEFDTWADERGFTVHESTIHTQSHLFNSVPDAIVYATVARSRHGKTSEAA